MVQIIKTEDLTSDGLIDQDNWLHAITSERGPAQTKIIHEACFLARLAGEHIATYTGQSCWQQGLAMAHSLTQLNMDADTLAAAIVYPSMEYAGLSLEDVKDHLGETVSQLIYGVNQLEIMRSLHGHPDHRSASQVETLRKMLLAMVQDVRVVVIKLAERATMMRNIAPLGPDKCRLLATETMDIFAPLANRLGISAIKWEMEDLSFRYLQGNEYKTIAKALSLKRIERESFVEYLVTELKLLLKHVGINAYVYGRAKHIYSIYRKMQRKQIGLDQIYDAFAIRVLVDDVEECYKVLSIVHEKWQHIPEEFDDYIATPKENGYRSIHTAVKSDNNLPVEIQIRTHEMHEECEMGMAAHWVYKEGPPKRSGYEEKIAWLRQVLEWQSELDDGNTGPQQNLEAGFQDRVYVFTPTGDIVDIRQGATPLDFAYHIHSEVGHRCRGAKINDKIVPLTTELKTGDRVEILTQKTPHPSRDWLNPHLGYIKTPRAKAKIHHWFKQQDFDKNLIAGQEIYQEEIKRLGWSNEEFDLNPIIERYNFKTEKDLFAGLGCGDIKLSQIINVLHKQLPEANVTTQSIVQRTSTQPDSTTGICIEGVGNLLTNFAKCCKPLPGDDIIGYVTSNHGVSIHRQDCANISYAEQNNQQRLLEVTWGADSDSLFPVTIHVHAYDRRGLLNDVSGIISYERINLLSLTTTTNKQENTASFSITVEINNLDQLSRLLARINQLPNVIEVKRLQN